jgi:5S rRNA maturation endonuclease (ribonuclease M5)
VAILRHVSTQDVNDAITPLDRILDLLEGVRAQNGGFVASCPAHDDRVPSLSISEGDDGRILLYCHAGCSTDDILDRLGLEWPDLFANGWAEDLPAPEAVYPYTAADGELRFEVVRLPGKRFLQRRPDPDSPGGYLWNREGLEPVLYRLPAVLVAAASGEVIYVVEGEKDVEALERAGVTATCNPGGAGKWRPEYAEVLRGARVVIVADLDEPGLKHARGVEDSLTGVAAAVDIVEPAVGKDAADHLDAGLAPSDFQPLGERELDEVGRLVDELIEYLTRFVVLDPVQAIAIALWLVHTHVFGAAEATPYLQVTSAEKRSGKSRLLDVLEPVVAKPWRVISPTEATLFRYIDAEQPTLLIDEYDTIFSRKDHEGLRAILNAGFQPGTPVPRVVGDGHHRQVEMFNVYCPKAMAGIGTLPDTVADRSIKIELKRRKATEQVDRARRRLLRDAGQALRARLEAVAPALIPRLAEAAPEIPDELDDRAADIWEPLLAIADLGGEAWGRRARQAAVALATGESREEDSRGLMLLRDIRRVLVGLGVSRISTAVLIRELAADEESPWAEWWDEREEKPAKGSQRELARLLKPYGVQSRTLRIDGAQAKGYECADFRDAWARYLPREAPESVPSVPSSLQADQSSASGTEGTDSRHLLETGWRLEDSEIRRLLDTHQPTIVGRDDITTRSERYQLALLHFTAERTNERRVLAEADALVAEGVATWRDS